MKLNNHGWGFRDMFKFMTALILFLFFTVFLVYKYYRLLDKKNIELPNSYIEKKEELIENNRYAELELKLKNATVSYILHNYNLPLNDGEVIIVKASTLISKDLMTYIYDLKDTSVCNGYTKVKVNGNNFTYTPYLSCSNYKTTGYDGSLIK